MYSKCESLFNGTMYYRDGKLIARRTTGGKIVPVAMPDAPAPVVTLKRGWGFRVWGKKYPGKDLWGLPAVVMGAAMISPEDDRRGMRLCLDTRTWELWEEIR